MKQGAYCLFDSPLGWCAIAWSAPADDCASPVVTFLQLPEATRKLTEARIGRQVGGRGPSVPPPGIAAVIERVCKHLAGDVQDFRDVAVDLEGVTTFARRVYEAARGIPPGQTVSYGDLARSASRPGAARAVGHALARNPVAIIIPCHRILGAGGKPGGFSAHGGRATKARLLASEGLALW